MPETASRKPLPTPLKGPSMPLLHSPEPVAHQPRLFGPRDRWVHRWRVPSRSVPGKRYTVAVDRTGAWGCSCPGWIYHRARCVHIEAAAGESRPLA